MIDATEARRLYNLSGQEANDFITNQLEQSVTRAATAGKREYFLDLGTVDAFTQPAEKITPLLVTVIDKLKILGYSVKITKSGDPYVPRGLQSDFDSTRGPMHTNYGIIIQW